MPISVNPNNGTREKLTLGLAVFISLLLLILPLNRKVVVADMLASILTHPYSMLEDFVVEINQVHNENNNLKADLAEISINISSMERVTRERDHLRAALGLIRLSELKLIPCEIQQRELSSDGRYVLIRSVEDSNWFVNQAVVSSQGLFGRIFKIKNKNEAWVELLTSPSVAVGCELSRTGLLGLLQPKSGKFELDMIGRDEDVVVGDVILTSGIGERVRTSTETIEAMPRGIPVGKVISVSSPPDRLFKSILVEPATSFNSLGVVFVVSGDGDWFNMEVPEEDNNAQIN